MKWLHSCISIIQRIGRFFALSSEEKFLFLEASIVLGFMQASVLLVSFKRLTRSLQHSKDKIKPNTLTELQLHTAGLVSKVIMQAANNVPWENTCLAQALTAQKMLNKRNIPGVFYLGAMKKNAVGEELEAHAWSQCGDVVITGERGHEAFTVFSVFEWGRG